LRAQRLVLAQRPLSNEDGLREIPVVDDGELRVRRCRREDRDRERRQEHSSHD